MGKCNEVDECITSLVMRTKEQIDRIQSTHGNPISIKNIVDVEPLKNYYKDNSNKIIQKNTGPKILEVDPNELLFSNLIYNIKRSVGEFEVRYIHYFDVTHPHIIHNDDTFEYPNCYKAFTIPLEIYGDSDDIKLVVYDQYYYGGPAKFFNGETKKDGQVYYNTPITDYNDVYGVNENGIPENIKNNYLTHLKDNWLKGLSINAMLDWKIGDVLCFDSLALHSSSDFINKNVSRKIGISIFTTL